MTRDEPLQALLADLKELEAGAIAHAFWSGHVVPVVEWRHIRSVIDKHAPRCVCDEPPVSRQVICPAHPTAHLLNCPVCGSGEEGACICALAEQIAEAEWNDSGLAVREGPWSAVGIIKRRSLIVKALPEAAKQSGGDV